MVKRRQYRRNGPPPPYTKHDVETRARALASNMGFSPDEMVVYNGGQSAPRWREFSREAKKILEIECRVPPMPQPEEYSVHPLVVVGDHGEKTIEQMEKCAQYGNVVGAALCADGHMGYAQAVGGVIAYENQISISGVGCDIACGNHAVRLSTTYGELLPKLDAIQENIKRRISFGMVSSKKKKMVEHSVFAEAELWKASDMDDYRDHAARQLGTVGGGNHYVDIFVERIEGIPLENCPVWVGVHFGSRGLGHTTAMRYLDRVGAKDGIWEAPAIVDVNSDIGERYLAGMKLSGLYAYAGRERVVEQVVQSIGGEVTKSVHNHHNFGWLEEHNGRKLWVVRKGATPAFPGQEGFVGGSMGDDAVILEGVDSELSRSLMYSTVHGAGREFSRNTARSKFSIPEMEEWVGKQGIRLIGGDVDESPMAYRRLVNVLAHHSGTIKINHVLKPVLVAMAGRDIIDPFKD